MHLAKVTFVLVLCEITLSISVVFKNILLLMGSLGLSYITELHVGVCIARIKNQPHRYISLT